MGPTTAQPPSTPYNTPNTMSSIAYATNKSHTEKYVTLHACMLSYEHRLIIISLQLHALYFL